MLGVILTMTMVLMTSMALTRERERGLTRTCSRCPPRDRDHDRKITPNIAIGFVQSVIVLLAAKLIFSVPMIGPCAAFGGTCAFIVANLAVGYTFSTIAATQLRRCR